MKQKLVKGVRKALPAGAVRHIEEAYRRGRVRILSAKYGNPAKGLKVIAVTGTNGKTTTINYINEILKEAGCKTAMFSTAVIEIAGDRANRLAFVQYQAHGAGFELVGELAARSPLRCVGHRCGHRIRLSESDHETDQAK